jgi:hypothetical protein
LETLIAGERESWLTLIILYSEMLVRICHLPVSRLFNPTYLDNVHTRQTRHRLHGNRPSGAI